MAQQQLSNRFPIHPSGTISKKSKKNKSTPAKGNNIIATPPPPPQPAYVNFIHPQVVPGLSSQAQALYDKIYRVPESAPRNIKDRAQIGLILFDIMFRNHPIYFNVMAETMNDTIDTLTPCLAFNRGNCRITAALHSQTKTKHGELEQVISHICEYCYYGRWSAGIHKAINCDLRPLLLAQPVYTALMGALAPPTALSRLTLRSTFLHPNQSQNSNVQMTIQNHESPEQRASVSTPPEPVINGQEEERENLSLPGPSMPNLDVMMEANNEEN